MDNANPYESPSTPPTRVGDKPKSGRWRSALSGVLVFLGVCFLSLLNGQVFTNTVVFLGFCTISLFIWIPVVLQSSQNQDRRIAFYVIVGHIVVIIAFTAGLAGKYKRQKSFNAIIEGLRHERTVREGG